MKTLKSLAVICFALLTSFNSWGQKTIHREATINYDYYDYGPPVGVVNGTATYHFTIHLTKEGVIESLHWNIQDINLLDENGNKVKVVDSGVDKLGLWWEVWNDINAWNITWGAPNVSYDVPDGWLSDIMPSAFPTEGIYVDLSFKILVKGNMLKLPSMAHLVLNANSDVIVDIVKP